MRENMDVKQMKRIYICSIFMMGIMILIFGNRANAEGLLQLQATISDYQNVLLQWESDGVENTFQIHRCDSESESYTILATLSGQEGIIKCHDYNVSMGQEYTYKIVQVSGEDVLRESEAVTLRVTLATPTKVKTKVIKNSRIQVSWKKVNRATSYTVYRSNRSNKGYKKLTTVKKNNYTDYDVEKGQSYYYKIEANYQKKKDYTSAKSEMVSAHIKPATPTVVGSYIKKKIKLTWNKVQGADVYYVYKKNSKGQYKKIKETKKLYYRDDNVKKGKYYSYQVVAVCKVDGTLIKGNASEPCKVLAEDIDPKKKMVALTYDDGPGRYTEDILKCLKNNQAKATFYVIGCNIDSNKNALIEAEKMGCEIGNHSYNHPDLVKKSDEVIKKELYDTDVKIKKLIGHNAVTMRPPGGCLDHRVEQVVGKPIILWSIDTRDWEHRNSNQTVRAVMNNVQDGDVVLMHDIYAATKDASLVLIPQLRRAGYQLVTVSELAQYRNITLEQGKVYRNFRKKR